MPWHIGDLLRHGICGITATIRGAMLPRTGDLLGRKYRLGAELGRGAMGIVYEARHETLEQSVAIKILRAADLDDRQAAVRRFEREARIIAKLDSAHVVKVVDVDHTDDGVPYLVMERLAGRDLSAEVEARGETRVPPGEAVTWMAQVCAAMVVAHEAGVVHRDLKLSNVFLGDDGVVKVLDFGVAVLKHADAERSITTSVAGTPRYMAPEQLLGESPNPASDVWAIGVMLYRLLGGRFPFDAPTMAAQMLAMMDGCPPLGTLAPELPAALTAVVTKALGHGLEQRWRSAKELGEALGPFTGERAGAATGESRGPGTGDRGSTNGGTSEARVDVGIVAAPGAAAPPARTHGPWIVAALLLVLTALGVRASRVYDADAPAVMASPAAASSAAPSPPPSLAARPSAPQSPSASASASASARPSASALPSLSPSPSPSLSPSATRAPRTRASGSTAPPPSASVGDGFPAHL